MGFFDSITKAIPGVSDILGGVGGFMASDGAGKNTQQSLPQSGFGTLSPDIQQWLIKNVLPQIQGMQKRGYQSLPTRRVDANDTDPLFGSPARVALQQYLDAQSGAGNPVGLSGLNNVANTR